MFLKHLAIAFIVVSIAASMSPREPTAGFPVVVLAASTAPADDDSTITIISSEQQCTANGVCVNMDDTQLWLGGEPNVFSVEEEIAGVKEILNSLSEEEQSQLVKSVTSMPIRYFRGAKGDAEKAVHYIKNTLQWRESFGVDEIINCVQDDNGVDPKIRKQIVQEHETGGMYVRGYDKDGRAIICAHLEAPNTGDEEAQLRSLVYTLEKAFACTARKSTEIGGKPLQKVIMLFDFEGYSRKESYSLHTLKKVNEILSFQYPERLTAVYFFYPPAVFGIVWSRKD